MSRTRQSEGFEYFCRTRAWNAVCNMLNANFDLIHKGIYLIIEHGGLEVLKHVLQLIRKRPENQGKLLYEVFEKKRFFSRSPIHHAVVFDKITIVKFLVEHCPSGTALLESLDDYGNTCAHSAAYCDNDEILKFIIWNTLSGIAILDLKNKYNRTPRDMMGEDMKEYCTPLNLRKIGLERELSILQNNHLLFGTQSLIALMFGVMMQNIEVQLWRLQLE